MSWRRKIDAALQPFKLTHGQFVVLACLEYLSQPTTKLTQAQVAKQAQLDVATTSQILRTLEKKKLVNRISQSSDCRIKSPTLTLLGKNILAKALPEVEKTDIQFFSPLSKNIKQLLELLRSLTIN
ncbi:MarR family transcriptional regulator [bacterium]|nr:MarR family transcriptional regulator [bacterium]